MAIKIIEIELGSSYLQPEHDSLNTYLEEGWTIIGHSTFVCASNYGETGEFAGETAPFERFTLYNSDGKGEILNTAELTLDTITSIERGETSNSNSPLWRCTTANGERVNIFKHDDPAKDNFHLFEAKGWGEVLLALELYNRVDTYPFAIAMKQDGRWWSIVDVMQAPVAQIPVFDKRYILPGDESLDDVLPLWSAADDKAAAEHKTPYQVKISQMTDDALKKEHDDNQYYERMYGKSVLTVQDERNFFKYHEQLNATESELEQRKTKTKSLDPVSDDEQEGVEHGE